jgi:hypothetical protein
MHPGIEIRISTPAGVILQCDSDFAHDSTLFRGVQPGEWHTVLRHLHITAEGQPMLDDGLVPDVAQLPASLVIEFRPVELPDIECPDDLAGLDMPAAPEGGTGAAERCCVCESARVSYHNYLNQPFCWRCADGRRRLVRWRRLYAALRSRAGWSARIARFVSGR